MVPLLAVPELLVDTEGPRDLKSEGANEARGPSEVAKACRGAGTSTETRSFPVFVLVWMLLFALVSTGGCCCCVGICGCALLASFILSQSDGDVGFCISCCVWFCIDWMLVWTEVQVLFG